MQKGIWLLALTLAGAATRADIAVDIAPGESIRLHRLDPSQESIRIDGVLDESLWERLPAYDEFAVIEPDTLQNTSHRTLIRLAYDDRGLYVGAEMLQPPETLIARLSGRDQGGINRDGLNLTLDTSGAGRYGFWFGVNLGDSLVDGTVLPERRFSTDWDGPWRGRSQATDTGWTAELFIPWSTVSMPTSGEVRQMGLYMSRKVAYLDERWGWPPLPHTAPKFMSALQDVEMNRVAPRQQYNVYPFLGVTGDLVEDAVRYRVGADMFWRPSSNFQLNATVNPDFGNVESDDVVINLSATETYFSEKRLFFLEGQEVFVATPRASGGGGLGNSGPPYTMVHTRRIGGPPTSPDTPPGVTVPDRELYRPADLLGAAKVTGQSGGARFGALAAFEDDVTFDAVAPDGPMPLYQDGSDYGIGRVLYEDNTASGAYRALGVLSTAVRGPGREAIAHGIDGHYLTATGKLKMDGQLMTSDIEGEGRGYGGFIDFEYSFRRGMSQRLGLEYFDERFDINDLGFLQRNDHYRVRSSFNLTRSNLGWARDNELDIRGFLQKNLSQGLFTGGALLLADRVTFHNLSSITARLHFFPEVYDDLNSFGNGTYRIEERVESFLFWSSGDTRTLSYGMGTGGWEEHLGGQAWLSEAWLNWRPNDRVSLNMKVIYRDRDGWLLHQDDDLFATFEARQWQPKVSLDYFINARQQFRVALQWVGIKARQDELFRVPSRPGDLIPIAEPAARDSYDFSVSRYSFQARYRWEIAPLSDVFLVYTRQADVGAALGEEQFRDLFERAWEEPMHDVLVFKVRYRLGS